MKKIVLSLSLILVFSAYAFSKRGESEHVQVTKVQDTPTPVATQGIATPTTSSAGGYKNGTFTGSVEDAFYGNIQVQVAIQGGKIADVAFLQYPSDRDTSIAINTQAMPFLKQEAIQAQSAQVDIVTGATDSSIAFKKSLQTALNAAKQ